MKNNQLYCFLAFFFFVTLTSALFADNTNIGKIPLLSIQKNKMVDETSRLPLALRSGMADILHDYLQNAGFKVVEEEMLLAAVKENDKADLIGEMDQDANGDTANIAVPRYFVSLRVRKCDFILKDDQRVFQMIINMVAIDAKTGKSICSILNDKPVEATNTKDAVNKSIELLIPKFISSIPQRFRPEIPSGKLLKIEEERILVKIPQAKIQVGQFLDVFKLETLDLNDDDDDDDDDDIDEIYVGTLKVIETHKKYCVCIPVGKGKFEKDFLARKTFRKIKE